MMEGEEPPRRPLKRLHKVQDTRSVLAAQSAQSAPTGPKEHGVRIAVCGTINSGKCSLINLLLGVDLLPSHAQGTSISELRVDIDGQLEPLEGGTELCVLHRDGTSFWKHCTTIAQAHSMLSDLLLSNTKRVVLRTQLPLPFSHITKFPGINMLSTDVSQVASQVADGNYDAVILTCAASNSVHGLMCRDFMYHLSQSLGAAKPILVLSETQDPLMCAAGGGMSPREIKRWFATTLDGAKESDVLVVPFGAHSRHWAIDEIKEAIKKK